MGLNDKNKISGGSSKFPMIPLLMVLFLAFSLSFGLLGFQLGKNAYRGAMVDTIVLSPGDSPARPQTTLHFLAGRLCKADGTPWAGVTVSLENGLRSDVTDEQGKFYLSDVRSGEHTLKVTDSEGAILADTKLFLDFSGAEITSDTSGEAPSFAMPEETRLIELTFIAGEDQSLSVDGTSACFVTKSGQIVTFDGTALQVKEPARAVTPAGNLVDTAGYVAIPAEALTITPQGQQVLVEPGEEAMPGAELTEEGTIQLEEGPAVLPDGKVELPGGDTVGGGDKVVVVEEETAQELEVLPEIYMPPAAAVPDQVRPQEDPGQVSSEPGDSGQEEETPSQPEEPQEPAYQGLAIRDEIGATWGQETLVNLFCRRDADGKPLPGIMTVQPGDSGYYDFRLENPENFDIIYTISIKENTFHLPIMYTVSDKRNNHAYFYEDTSLGVDDVLTSEEIYIPSGTAQNYRLIWDWQYEDWFDYRWADALDTAGGMRDDLSYEVSLFIRAEQVLTPDWYESDGDLKYPGVHGNIVPMRE